MQWLLFGGRQASSKCCPHVQGCSHLVIFQMLIPSAYSPAVTLRIGSMGPVSSSWTCCAGASGGSSTGGSSGPQRAEEALREARRAALLYWVLLDLLCAAFAGQVCPRKITASKHAATVHPAAFVQQNLEYKKATENKASSVPLYDACAAQVHAS